MAVVAASRSSTMAGSGAALNGGKKLPVAAAAGPSRRGESILRYP